MPTEVTIIEVDLTKDVQRIITEEIAEITGTTGEQIKTFQAAQLAVKELSDQKNRKSEDTDRKLQEVYDRLLDAGDKGVIASEVTDHVKPELTTASAFTNKFKNWLRCNGGLYIVARKRINKADRYVLQPWNLDAQIAEEDSPST